MKMCTKFKKICALNCQDSFLGRLLLSAIAVTLFTLLLVLLKFFRIDL